MLPSARLKFLPSLGRSASTYSFLSKATIKESPASQAPRDALLKGKGLMQHLSKTLPSPEAQSLMSKYFSKSSPERIRPGSVLSVTLNHAPNNFSGVVVAVRHKGPDTSFVLRNVVQRTGVEMRFNVASPGLKDIKVIQKAQDSNKRIRRAKLYYLREQPSKMTAISAGIKRNQAAASSSYIYPSLLVARVQMSSP
ncbi:hypothetical protein FRC03_002623 [Tulasnella sp. 419]|nr:hypothetical protein FRC03_002623 [Tulasnella sp. 419]